jgi:hypothetical protein
MEINWKLELKSDNFNADETRTWKMRFSQKERIINSTANSSNECIKYSLCTSWMFIAIVNLDVGALSTLPPREMTPINHWIGSYNNSSPNF